MADELRALLIGDATHAEFRAAVETLSQSTTLVRARDVASALTTCHESAPPDVVVIAQPYSGCIPADEVDQLRRLAPLARVIVLLGSWCEGESRSGLPIPGATRIYWHQWPARWEQELARLAAGRCPAWGLPVTATDDDRLLHFAYDDPPQLRGTVAIVASPETAGWLAAVCRGVGLTPLEVAVRDVRARKRPACDLVVFEAAALGYDQSQDALRWARGWHGVPLVALCEFPRIEDREAWTSAGVRAVLARPVLVDDLRWHLAALLETKVAARD